MIFDPQLGFNTVATYNNCRCTDWKSQNAWSFTVKLMNDNFPTLDNLAERHPEYFTKTSCFFCNSQLETMTTCQTIAVKWDNIITKAVSNATAKARKNGNFTSPTLRLSTILKH